MQKGVRGSGFTLIEMMIAVGIIGILAAIAYPSYLESVRKGRRADAQAALVGLAAAMEREFMKANTYVDPSTFYPTQVPLEGGTATYTLSAAVTATTYTLTATAVGTQASDSKCTTLTLSSAGAQGFTGTGPVSTCWRQ